MIITTAPHTSYRRIWQLSWPVMVSNTSLPLVGAVDVAMMGHLPDPAFVGGVALGGLIFYFLYLTFGFLRHYLDGLLFAFILYLIIRGLYLVACLPSVLRLSQASGS